MEQLHLTTSNWIIIACTIFNICYLIGWCIAGFWCSRRRMHCVRCKRDFSRSIMCKYCKYYKNSLAYFAHKHPKKLEQIGIEDNYKKKEGK